MFIKSKSRHHIPVALVKLKRVRLRDKVAKNLKRMRKDATTKLRFAKIVVFIQTIYRHKSYFASRI